MTEVPRYCLLPGTEITLLERPMVVTGTTDQGYQVAGLEDGVITVLPFGTLAQQLKLPGARIDTAIPKTGGKLKQRLGGFLTAQSLSEEQRELGRFHFALCKGMEAYRARLRAEHNNPGFRLSHRIADTDDARRFIAVVAAPIFGKKIHLNPPRGGKSKGYCVYHGRTLMKYFQIFESLQADETPVDALVTLDHLKGNRTVRICNQLRKLMTEAWEHIGLDLKGPSVSNVRKHLETRIWQENEKRIRNALPELVVPSDRTIKKHRDSLITPTEYLIATQGRRHARNKRGRGSTDLRALLIGELGEMDECKISLVMSAKRAGLWEQMSDEDKGAIEALEKYIKSRFWILVMIDVASRMPLAWVIAENPNAEATLALLRMATRDKTREKLFHGCTGEPAAAVGLLHVKNDNGTGLRNAAVVGALMGSGSINTTTRAYASTDRPHIERLNGTLEMDVVKLLHGYTGRKPGELPGYDAMANGVITVDQLHEIVTQYFIDEYPSTRHHGVGMGGRRPIEVYKTINMTRGQVHPIDPHIRRIQLGWEENVTPTDEGVRVFHGIWFNSDEFQKKREKYAIHGKVKVFVDPDDIKLATIILPKVEEPIEVQLEFTAFADMTLPEVLRLMAELRRENPAVSVFHEDQVMRTRIRRQAQLKAIGVEHDLPRSYSTVEECRNMSKVVFAGARMIRSKPSGGTTRPGEITSVHPSDGVYSLGGQDSPIDGRLETTTPVETLDQAGLNRPETDTRLTPDSTKPVPKTGTRRKKSPSAKKSPAASERLARPKNLKDLQ